MKGLRTFGSWIFRPLRQSERTSFRIFGATRCASVNSPMQSELADRRQRSMPLIKLPPQFYSRSTSEFGKKSRTYWSAIAAGLIGITGISFIFDKSDSSFLKNLFTTVHCDGEKKGDDKCGCCNDDCIEKKCETSECLRKTDCDEEVIRKANADLERALRETKGAAVQLTEQALKAYCDAIAAIKEFMNMVYCAVEEENLESPRFDAVWAEVYKALKKRCVLAQDATEKGACAWELLKRLREIIKEGKCCKYTSCNPLLVTAEETLICAEKEICAKKKEMEKILKQSRPVEQYRNLVEEFRRDLKAEADSLVPSAECRVTLNCNEANMVLTHAYKKILRIQKEMSDALGGECSEEEK